MNRKQNSKPTLSGVDNNKDADKGKLVNKDLAPKVLTDAELESISAGLKWYDWPAWD